MAMVPRAVPRRVRGGTRAAVHHRRLGRCRPVDRLGPRVRRLAELQRREARRRVVASRSDRTGEPAVHRPRRRRCDRRRAGVAHPRATAPRPHLVVGGAGRRRDRSDRAGRHHGARRPAPRRGAEPLPALDGPGGQRHGARVAGGHALESTAPPCRSLVAPARVGLCRRHCGGHRLRHGGHRCRARMPATSRHDGSACRSRERRRCTASRCGCRWGASRR